MKKLFIFIFLVCLFLLFPKETIAITDPLVVPNNFFGIHIFNEKDIEDAERLVNSSGGDWGYVTFVITETERDHNRWQEVFNKLRRLHLIPIVRIATKPNGDVWEKPQYEEINNWLAFLNSLNWVVQNRYVVVGNEPNHAKEWGGEVSPKEYATYLKTFTQKAKEANENFFILPAGLDASSSNSKETMEEAAFIRKMVLHEPDVFDLVDGLNSHSYPNPAFSGSERAKGKGTVATFEWELSFLKSLGVDKDLPVFITETGWVQSAGSLDKRFTYGFQNVWKDKRIVAVTPFILNYSEPPFDVFSWKNKEGNFRPTYEAVRNISKTKGLPHQIIKGDIIFSFLQPIGLSGTPIKGLIYAKNTGQNIWDETNTNVVQVAGENLRISNVSIPTIEPSKLGLLVYDAKVPEIEGSSTASVDLLVNGDKIGALPEVEVISVHPETNKWGLFWEKVIIKIESVFLSLKQILRVK